MLPRISQLKQKTTAVKAVCFASVFFCFCLFFSPLAAHAQATDPFGVQSVGQGFFLGGTDIRVIIVRIIEIALGFLGIIAVSLILYAGYTIMTAGGNEEKVAEGKTMIKNAVIGLAIILSAFSIVQFIFLQLAGATGARGTTSGGRPVSRSSFAGSGALGPIIADHYPERDELDVRRNTRIAVTFREPIDPASLIANKNGSVDAEGNEIFGDCVLPAAGPLNWATDCDQLLPAAVQIFPTADTHRNALVAAAAIAVPEGAENDVFTVVFRPIELLGSDSEDVPYTVDLLGSERASDPGIKKADGVTSAFIADRDNHYLWEFETGTRIDTDPPTVVDVYPAPGDIVPRNSIVQVTFSEAMDPSVVQGRVGNGGSFRNIIFGSQTVSGNWRVTNAYRTVEFVSDVACGQNSCGEVIYCLPPTPAPCPAGERCKAALIRTSRLVSPQTPPGRDFEAMPLSGVADMAGNALDGDADTFANDRPALPPDPRHVGAGEQAADNSLWEFTVNNDIDRTAPYVRELSPGIDFESVPAGTKIEVTFSGRMWGATLGGMSLLEHGAAATLPPPWYRVRSSIEAIWYTKAIMDHRDFIDSTDTDNDGLINVVYYFPFIPSTVKSATQNCLYPGRGPATNVPNSPSPTICVYNEDENGEPLPGTGNKCTPVAPPPVTAATDSGCVSTNLPASASWLVGNLSACETQLRSEAVSPLETPL